MAAVPVSFSDRTRKNLALVYKKSCKFDPLGVGIMPQTWARSNRIVNPNTRVYVLDVDAPRVVDDRAMAILVLIVVTPPTSGSVVINDCRHLTNVKPENQICVFDWDDADRMYPGSIIQLGDRLMRGLCVSETGPGGKYITVSY